MAERTAPIFLLVLEHLRFQQRTAQPLVVTGALEREQIDTLGDELFELA